MNNSEAFSVLANLCNNYFCPVWRLPLSLSPLESNGNGREERVSVTESDSALKCFCVVHCPVKWTL